MGVRIPATGTGDATPIVASDLIAGEHHQYMKLETGDAGTATPVTSTNPLPTGFGKTLKFVAISQGAAATTQLVAADATRKIKVANYVVVLAATGSVKFIDSNGDLTGLMTFGQYGGVAAPGQAASHWFETAVNAPLSIVSNGGAANGHLSYFLEA